MLACPGSDQCIVFASGGGIFARAGSYMPCAQWCGAEGWHLAQGSPLPAPGVSFLPDQLITPIARGLHIGYDILGLAYWMLNRMEEIGRTDLDCHGRFPATASHGYQHSYLERPIVDEWLHILGQAMQRVWPGIKLKQHQFSMKISHDVDNPSLYAFKPWGMIARMMAGRFLKHRDLPAFVKAPYVKLASRLEIHPSDPCNTFDWIMDRSDRLGLTSAFYFICGYTAPYDADYHPGDPRIRKLIRHIHARGHEIGLHPSYATYQQPELIRQEADCLRRICAEEGVQQDEWGGRMHYLRWEHPTTLQALSDAGMSYDSTLGYADRPGFRCGTCFDFPAFNPTTQQELPLRVRPLVMMEGSVIEDVYMGLGSGQAALEKALDLKAACKSVGGCFTLLWHNSELQKCDHREMFINILEL